MTMHAQREIHPQAKEPSVLQVLSEPARPAAPDTRTCAAPRIPAVDAAALCMLHSALGG
jgi:hypothetical protein